MKMTSKQVCGGRWLGVSLNYAPDCISCVLCVPARPQLKRMCTKTEKKEAAEKKKSLEVRAPFSRPAFAR